MSHTSNAQKLRNLTISVHFYYNLGVARAADEAGVCALDLRVC